MITLAATFPDAGLGCITTGYLLILTILRETAKEEGLAARREVNKDFRVTQGPKVCALTYFTYITYNSTIIRL